MGTPATYAQRCVHVLFSQTIWHSLIPRLYTFTEYSLGTRLTIAHVESLEQQIVLRVVAECVDGSAELVPNMTDLTGVVCPSRSVLSDL